MTLPNDSIEELAREVARLREELGAAVRAREALLGGIAHDLRNPLNTFAMSTGLLKDDLEREELDPKRALSLVGRMERATYRMQLIIDDLVEAGHIDARRVPLVRKVVPAATVVTDAVAAARAHVTEKGAAIQGDDVDSALEASLDKARVVQALVKAVAFLLRSVGEGGTLHIGARSSDEASGVTFYVCAAAPGDPASSQGTSVDEGRGGLSLLIARGIAAAHGGQATVDATNGLRVSITLPSSA